MRSTLTLDLGLLLLVLTTPINARADGSLVYSGEYEIRKCNAGQPNSMASKLQKMLPLLWSDLQMTIADVTKRTQSTHGYSAFFKMNDSIPEVQSVYRDMADGKKVDKTNAVLTSPGRNVDPINLANPGLICIQDGDPSTAAHYLACTTPTRAGGMIAAVGAQYVFQDHDASQTCDSIDGRTLGAFRINALSPRCGALISKHQIGISCYVHASGIYHSCPIVANAQKSEETL